MSGSRIAAATLLPVGALGLALIAVAPRPIRLGSADYDRVDLRVNEFTKSAQAHATLDLVPEGSLWVAWDSRRQQEGTYGVYARKVDASGALEGPEEAVNLFQDSMQENPAIVGTGSTSPLVAWVSTGQDGQGSGVFARSSGDEHQLNQETQGEQSEVALASLGDGRAVAVWTTPGEAPEQRRVVGRFLDDGGAPIGDEFAVSKPGAYADRIPAVAASRSGAFVVAWDRTDPDGTIEGIFVRRFGPEGTALGPELHVSDGPVDQIEPTVAMDAAGDFAVGWMRLDPKTDYDPMMRRYDAAGVPLSRPEPVCAERDGWQSGIALAMNERGEIAAVWNDSFDDGGSDIRGRLFAADGTPLTGDLAFTDRLDGRRRVAAHTGVRRVALGDDGRLAIAWEGNSGQGDETAANVTVLRPRGRNLLAAPAASIRRIRDRVEAAIPWIGRTRTEAPVFDPKAGPIRPPVFDPQTISHEPGTITRQGNGDIGFTGVTSTGWNPPDPHMAVGPNHIMLIVNGAIAAKTKDGGFLWQDQIEGTGGFWGSVGAGGFVFDPEVCYDPYEDRFYAMANEQNGSRSYLLLGVSSTGDPQDSWYKYRFNVTSIAGPGIDSPNLACDETGIYLTADFFDPDKYLILVVQKASVLSGGTAQTSSHVYVGTQSFGIPVEYTPDAPRMYMLEHFDGTNRTQLRLWAILDPFGSPTLTSVILNVDPYSDPGVSRSRGTSQTIYLFESRFWSCMYRNGSLWACHHCKVPGSSTCKARWYQIALNGWPGTLHLPEVVQSGTVDAGEGVYLTFNSIAADAEGNAYMVFARSSQSEYYSISRSYRLASDPLGTMSAPGFLKQGTSTYGGDRWGDYSAVNADPVEPGKFWSHHEWSPGGGGWQTWVQSETLPQPPASAPEFAGGPGGARIEVLPNPSRGPATIRFSSLVSGEARVEIFDAGGRRVRSLPAGPLGTGSHEISWDGRGADGAPAAAGVYLVRVTVDGVPVGSGRLIRTQ